MKRNSIDGFSYVEILLPIVFLWVGLVLGGCDKKNGTEISAPISPDLITTSISAINSTSAKSGGNIFSDGGRPVTNRGVVWSTSQNPTVSLPTKTSDGTGVGTYSSNLSGLTASTKYYVRAYVTNSSGSYYGNEVTFYTMNSQVCNENDFNSSRTYGNMTDQEGNVYKTLTFGSKVWMAENLRTGRYQNEDPIPNVIDNATWSTLKSGASCLYNNDNTTNHCRYGRLYNRQAVMDTRKLCPSGWHVPSHSEWIDLVTTTGGFTQAGGRMKSTSGWNDGNGSNSYGFTARPSGYRESDGRFYAAGVRCYWWSAPTEITYTWIHYLQGTNEWYANSIPPNGNSIGYSVRCVKD